MRRVGILLFDPVRVFEYAVAFEIWGVDRTGRGVPAFEVRVCGPRRAGVDLGAGVVCVPDHDLDGLDTCDLVVVPGNEQRTEPRREVFPDDVLEALRSAHRRGATIASLCSGAFVLAAAGLLDGRRATAHWLDTEDLARRYPKVTVDANVLFVGDGSIWTSAGSAAGIDLCLHLVRLDHGAAAAGEIARTMVTAPFRSGGQAQFISNPVPASPTEQGDSLGRLRDLVLDDLRHPWTVAELAALAGMSERSFARHFVRGTGTSPLRWLAGQRVLAAQRLLEIGDLSIAAIARECGFGSPLTLRQHFTRHVGVAPRDYRAAFRGGRGRPTANGGIG
ncbi:helix-turn-helix domain-containing protein [Embleya sp. NPDC005971]|uniref:GlxA family transcriptional regulator n=1 Tax=unclassified Embleya TaxID=2699296 RepID=UPI0033C24A9E